MFKSYCQKPPRSLTSQDSVQRQYSSKRIYLSTTLQFRIILYNVLHTHFVILNIYSRTIVFRKIRDTLKQGDFNDNFFLLLNLPPFDVEKLLKHAQEIGTIDKQISAEFEAMIENFLSQYNIDPEFGLMGTPQPRKFKTQHFEIESKWGINKIV